MGVAGGHHDVAASAALSRTYEALDLGVKVRVNNRQPKRIEPQYLFVFSTEIGKPYEMIASFGRLRGALLLIQCIEDFGKLIRQEGINELPIEDAVDFVG